jgi:dihydroorotase
MSTLEEITLRRPDDWHLHLRDGEVLGDTVAASAATVGRALVMPNLQPPIVNVEMALAYRDRILKALERSAPPRVANNNSFKPLMALYLTDHTSRETVVAAARAQEVLAFKLYPAGATTHSEDGVTDIGRCTEALEEMEKQGVVLCIHGEVTDSAVDVFDREAVFIDRVLIPLRKRFPGLRIVLEHLTTAQAVAYVQEAEGDIAATITPQHLLLNRNSLFQGGLRPHAYCLPVLKRERHRQALVGAATSGNPRFFMGTDSAPHSQARKEVDCGCAGCFTAPYAIALYAKAFEEANALERLDDFCSSHGADFYQLPRGTETVRLRREPQVVADQWPFGGQRVIPLLAGTRLEWSLIASESARPFA